ncbi:terminase, partial [Klebsiella pneumoniae]|nr:terminase [Klebsiella pneumoniae]HCL5810788.1 terminase [Klebsiella pneumoniae]HCM4997961.1 terminase [Klebsiella pneumoniae]HCM5264082.1 terminase [Klebsiella pneumoniae]HCM7971407.1 terminase [Klebsiella pneumoniae]
ERDCALPPAAVSRVQSVIDDLRDQMAQKVMEAEAEEDEPEED